MKALAPLFLVALVAVLSECAPRWSTFRSDEGGFEVALPGEPEEKTGRITMSGKELKRHDFTAVVAGELPLRMPKVFYVVEYVDLLTELEARSAIDEVLDETRRGLEAREEYRRESRLDEQAASEVRLAATNNIITERIMVSGRRLYSVGVIQREGEAAENKRFFESFRLLPRRAAP